MSEYLAERVSGTDDVLLMSIVQVNHVNISVYDERKTTLGSWGGIVFSNKYYSKQLLINPCQYQT